MKPWLVVLLKELRDASRDRRAVLSLFIFPVLGPLLIWFMFNAIIDQGEEALDIELPVAGAQYAPDLIDYLQQNGIRIKVVDAPGTAEADAWHATSVLLRQLIEARDSDFALLIPADFNARLAAAQTVNIELHHDSSRNAAGGKVARVQGLINGWSQETAALRLMIRGINPVLIRPVNVSRIDVASGQARAQALLSMIPMFVIIAAFMSGVGVAVDATAGERERKSLEPLLVNPVQRSQLVLGKWLAATVFSIIGLILVLGLNLFALGNVPLEELGISFNIDAAEVLGILLVTLPIAFFATSLQIFIGIFAKSFKDAQVYIALLSFVPILPYFYNIFNSTGRELWMSFVPMLGQNMLLTDVVSGRTPPWPDMALAALMLIVWSGCFLALAARLLGRERIIFS